MSIRTMIMMRIVVVSNAVLLGPPRPLPAGDDSRVNALTRSGRSVVQQGYCQTPLIAGGAQYGLSQSPVPVIRPADDAIMLGARSQTACSLLHIAKATELPGLLVRANGAASG